LGTLGHEADNSPLCSAEGKNAMELYLHFPIHLHGMVLIKGNIILYLWTRQDLKQWPPKVLKDH